MKKHDTSKKHHHPDGGGGRVFGKNIDPPASPASVSSSPDMRATSTLTTTKSSRGRPSVLMSISLLLNILGGMFVYQLHHNLSSATSSRVHLDHAMTLPQMEDEDAIQRKQEELLQLHEERRKRREEKTTITKNSNNNLRSVAQQEEEDLIPRKKHIIPAFENVLGYDLKLIQENSNNNNNEQDLYSQGHCIGENFRPHFSWIYKSCKVEQLVCYDLKRMDWLVVSNPLEIALNQAMLDYAPNETGQGLITYASTTYDEFSLGVINPGWFARHEERDYEKTWMKLRTHWRHVQGPISNYYKLPSNVVMVPFHSMAGFNPGHYLWDDLLPIYTLLETFDYISSSSSSRKQQQEEQQQADHDDEPSYEPLLMRIDMDTNPKIWATCSDEPHMMEGCRDTMIRLGELIGSPTMVFDPLNQTSLFETKYRKKKHKQKKQKQQELYSNLICASQGVAGIGMLSDHGEKDHGWIQETDYEYNQNVGRGVHLWNFRNFILNKMNMSTNKRPNKTRKPLIVLSQLSSHRSFDLEPHGKYLQEQFPTTNVATYDLANWDLKRQLDAVSEASIYISIAGGGTFTAMFLPRGASLILYYTINEGPARLDYDVWNNLGYLRVHWIPFEEQSKPAPYNDAVLESLVRNELQVLKKMDEDEGGGNDDETEKKEDDDLNDNFEDVIP